MNPDLVLARLEGPALDGLIGLVVDHLLERPVAGLVDPDSVARLFVSALDTAAKSDRTEAWIRERVTAARGQVPPGRPGDRVPAELRLPLRDVVGRPYLPNRALIGRLLDHAAMERLLREVLTGTLRGFAKRLAHLSPPPMAAEAAKAGLGRLRQLSQGVRGLSDGVLGNLSHEIEHRAEARVREFVEEALQATLSEVADHMCRPENAGAYADWRVHILDTVLATENRVLAAELDKLDPDRLVATGAATARALAGRSGLQQEVAELVRTALETMGPRSLRDFLSETGLDAGDAAAAEAKWRAEVEAQLGLRGREIITTPAFKAWLQELLQEA